MLALDVLLAVVCVECGKPLTAAVKCEGDGLMESGAKALAHIGCPHCRQANHVVFVPETGEVVEVLRHLRIVRMPEPSVN